MIASEVGSPSPSHSEQFTEFIRLSALEAWVVFAFFHQTDMKFYFFPFSPRASVSCSEEFGPVPTEG